MTSSTAEHALAPPRAEPPAPRRAPVVVAAVASLLVASACGGSSPAATSAAGPATTERFPAGSTMAEISNAKRIRIGTKFDQPGFGLVGATGAPEGFDVEIGKGVAAQLGLSADQVEWVEAPSAERELLIEQDDVDLVVATYTITDERKQRVSFAGPYYVAGQQIMVRQGETRVHGPSDLTADPDLRVCSVTGSTPSQNVRPYLASPDQLVSMSGYDDCVEALRNGQVQAVTTDDVILLGYVAENPGQFALVGERFTQELYGIGLRKGDVAFCEFVNRALRTMSDEGAYDRAWTSTAGEHEGVEVPTLPDADLCA